MPIANAFDPTKTVLELFNERDRELRAAIWDTVQYGSTAINLERFKFDPITIDFDSKDVVRNLTPESGTVQIEFRIKRGRKLLEYSPRSGPVDLLGKPFSLSTNSFCLIIEHKLAGTAGLRSEYAAFLGTVKGAIASLNEDVEAYNSTLQGKYDATTAELTRKHRAYQEQIACFD